MDKKALKIFIKVTCIVLLLLLLIGIIGCAGCIGGVMVLQFTWEEYRIYHGLDVYHPHNSDYDVCNGLFPEALLDQYEYVEADYWFIKDERALYKLLSNQFLERAIIYFRYDTQTYPLAKEYVLNNFDLSSGIVAEYNGYFFYETDDSPGHPNDFKRFAYNDDKQELVFVSLFADVPVVDDVKDDFGALLEKFYGEYYSFS